jgi:hypothetical protein
MVMNLRWGCVRGSEGQAFEEFLADQARTLLDVEEGLDDDAAMDVELLLPKLKQFRVPGKKAHTYCSR